MKQLYVVLVNDGLTKHPVPDTSDLKTALKNGQRLSVYLRPNHTALAVSTPEYDEAYALPFVFSEGDAVAGLTRTGHYLADGKGGWETISFSYNTTYPYYSIQFPTRFDRTTNQIATKLMSKLQYQNIEFRCADAARLIYESCNTDSYQPRDYGLSDSIKAGKTHFVVVVFPGSRLWSLPVDISYDYYPTGEVEFKTETVLTSKHILMPETFHLELTSKNAHVADAMKHPNADLDIFLPADTTFLKILTDGTVFTASGQITETPTPYEAMKVYEYP